MTRLIAREDPTKRAARISRFARATPEQIDAYIDGHVTDLASAKEALKELAKAVAWLLRQQLRNSR